MQLFPNWSFTATDLSATMLDKAKHYIQPLDALHRVEFVLADVDQLKTDSIYDAALSILVTHFVPYAHKPESFKAIVSRLKQQGVFIGFDLTAMNTDQERGMLQHICEANGLSTAQSSAMLKRLADDFYPLSEQETFEQLSSAGFASVQRFTQVLSYQGIMALKV